MQRLERPCGDICLYYHCVGPYRYRVSVFISHRRGLSRCLPLTKAMRRPSMTGKQPSGSSRLFLCLYMNVLEHTLRDELMKNEEDLETANLVHGSYRELLFDVRWKQKRARILERDGYKCIVCGATEDLTVHHKQYHVDQQGRKHVPWDYEDKYLVTLCSVCHRNGHSKFNVPVFEV